MDDHTFTGNGHVEYLINNGHDSHEFPAMRGKTYFPEGPSGLGEVCAHRPEDDDSGQGAAVRGQEIRSSTRCEIPVAILARLKIHGVTGEWGVAQCNDE
jgi:hypothetical protein